MFVLRLFNIHSFCWWKFFHLFIRTDLCRMEKCCDKKVLQFSVRTLAGAQWTLYNKYFNFNHQGLWWFQKILLINVKNELIHERLERQCDRSLQLWLTKKINTREELAQSPWLICILAYAQKVVRMLDSFFSHSLVHKLKLKFTWHLRYP